MKKFAVIVAGGAGTRMGGPVAKQYLPIEGVPLLMHTLTVFNELDQGISLILVLPESDLEYWNTLCQTHQFTVPHQVVKGGGSRFQSVKNGLGVIPSQDGLVAIHDGVRPFVAFSVIRESFETAKRSGSAIAVVPLKDSIREVAGDGESQYRDRQYFRLVQTPQTFELAKIKKAFEVEEVPYFTDDATVYEHQGWQVSLIPGNLENIKITTPEDLAFAEYFIRKKKFNDI